MTDNILHIYLLGDLRITRGDEPVPAINSARAQSLLAYLVLHAGLPQSRRHLAFLLWPDSSDAQARSNLRKLLHDLRRALPDVDRFLDSQGPNLLWRSLAPFTLDVADFQRLAAPAASPDDLRRALALYQGPLFQSCYDDWILPERERLHQLFIDALARLIDLLEQQGDYRAAIHFAHSLLHHDPLHEDVYRSLMRLYALTDDRAAALRTFHTCAAVLKQELQVDPSPATQQAYDRLLQLPPPPLPAPAAPLVGHRLEWARLQAAWRLAAKGQPQWVLLSGAPGIGKTRLAEELVAWAAKQGIATAAARCYAAEAGLGYGPLTTWLRARPLPPLDPVWRSEIARLLPDLLVAEPTLPAPGPLTEPWQRLRFFEALARTLLASQPLVLFLDDLPFCDRDSLEWLHYLVRSNPHAALLILTTLCLEDLPLDTPLHPLFASLRRANQLSEIGVLPLSPDETAQLAAQLHGHSLSDPSAQRLFHATEGNPLFILEMVRAQQLSPAPADSSLNETANASANAAPPPQPALPAAWPLPRTMHAVIAGRLHQLSPQARTLAQLAAVIGRAFDVPVLAHASALPEDALAHALTELRHKRIVKAPLGSTYDFDHAQLAAVAYADLNPAERSLAHRRVAEALLALHPHDLPAIASEVVSHFERASLPDQALPYLVLAADAARRRYANETAIAFYRRALPLLPPPDQLPVLLKLGAVLELVGQWRDAEHLYRRALALAPQLAQPTAHAEAQLELGELLHRQGWDQQALPLLQAAHATFAALHAPQQVAHALETMGLIYEWQGDYEQALACHDQALALATQEDDPRGVSRALGNQGLVFWRQGHVDRALQAFHHQFQIAHDLDDQVGMSRALGRTGLVYLEQGRFAEALETLHKRLADSSAVGDRLGTSYATGQIGAVYYEQGDHARALEQYLQQLQAAEELGTPRGLSQGIRHIGMLYYQRGDFARARNCYARSLQIALSIGDWRIVSYLLGHLANAYSAECHEREAERTYALWHAWSIKSASPFALADVLYHHAHLYFRQQNYARAHSLLEEAARSAQEIGRRNLQFKIQLLTIRVRNKLGQTTTPNTIHTLQELIGDYPGEREQAALYYALWQLNHDQVAWRKMATKLYRHLYARTPKWTYAQRYQELTGRRLPEPPALPQLPALVTQGPVDLDALLDQVNAQLVASN